MDWVLVKWRPYQEVLVHVVAVGAVGSAVAHPILQAGPHHRGTFVSTHVGQAVNCKGIGCTCICDELKVHVLSCSFYCMDRLVCW